MRRPIRVLDLRDTDEIGGPGKTILETFRAVDRVRFDLHVGVFQARSETGDTPFVRAARAIGMPVQMIRGFNQYDPRLIARTAALVRRLEVDILHSHEVKSDVIAGLVRLVQPVCLVTTLHGWIGNSARQRALIAADKRVVRRFDRVIAVSRPIYDAAVTAGVSTARLRLLHNAIVLDHYPRRTRRGDLGAVLGVPVAGPVVASIGRLSAEKGHADLIDALGLMRRRGHRVTAVLAGDGPERPALLDRIRANDLEGLVHLPGYVAQPQHILAGADLMVLPSHTEGLPNAALEAMAMDVPVLATRVGGTPEVVQDGETGRLVDPHRPERLAEAMEDFVVNPGPWAVMAARGRARVEREFDFRARTAALQELYGELVDR